MAIPMVILVTYRGQKLPQLIQPGDFMEKKKRWAPDKPAIRQEVEMRARDSESATIYTDVSGPRERRRERQPGTSITVDAPEQ